MAVVNGLVPKCPGPKLGPFRFHKPIHAIQVLGYVGSGAHSEVFKVKIDSKVYALKAFRFYRARELISFNLVDDGYVNPRQVIHHNDPFYAECRAYGRLDETGRTDLAARCYGYIFLTPTQESDLGSVLSTPADWGRRDEHNGAPLRCILKEYIDSETFFTKNMISRMKKNVKDLNNIGIVVFDIRKENFLDGIIIDFSQAHTTPHLELDVNSTWSDLDEIQALCARDYACFDAVVDEWNKTHPGQHVWQRFIVNKAFGKRLRNNDSFRKPLQEREGARLDVLKYNWNGRPPKRKQYQQTRKRRKANLDIKQE